MSPVREVLLIVERELSRNLRSAKGIVLAVLCILGGVGTSLVAVSGQKYVHRQASEEVVRAGREQAVAAMYGKDYGPGIGKALADAPEVLFVMMIGTLSLAALLAAFVGFDSVSAEMQHRGVRYWTVRSRRTSYIAGKFLGMFLVASTMTLLMSVCSWIAIQAKSDVPLGLTISWGIKLWVATLPISLAWCALVTFFSSVFRSPILALLVSCIGWMVFGLTYIIGKSTDNEWLTWLYPSSYDRLLLSPDPDRWLMGMGASTAFTAAFVMGALVLFQQRDV